jgi:hypothetical protein
MSDAFRTELRKFDAERVLPAWDGLIRGQQARLEALKVPTMFVTDNASDVEVRIERLSQTFTWELPSSHKTTLSIRRRLGLRKSWKVSCPRAVQASDRPHPAPLRLDGVRVPSFPPPLSPVNSSLIGPWCDT